MIYERTCPQCSRGFVTADAGKFFCSHKCMQAAKAGQGQATCPICGKSFAMRSANHKFCTPLCKKLSRVKAHKVIAPTSKPAESHPKVARERVSVPQLEQAICSGRGLFLSRTPDGYCRDADFILGF